MWCRICCTSYVMCVCQPTDLGSWYCEHMWFPVSWNRGRQKAAGKRRRGECLRCVDSTSRPYSLAEGHIFVVLLVDLLPWHVTWAKPISSAAHYLAQRVVDHWVHDKIIGTSQLLPCVITFSCYGNYKVSPHTCAGTFLYNISKILLWIFMWGWLFIKIFCIIF